MGHQVLYSDSDASGENGETSLRELTDVFIDGFFTDGTSNLSAGLHLFQRL